MLRSAPSVCVFCQVTAPLRPKWQQVRTYAMRRKRPSRMVLSDRVSRSGPTRFGGAGRERGGDDGPPKGFGRGGRDEERPSRDSGRSEFTRRDDERPSRDSGRREYTKRDDGGSSRGYEKPAFRGGRDEARPSQDSGRREFTRRDGEWPSRSSDARDSGRGRDDDGPSRGFDKGRFEQRRDNATSSKGFGKRDFKGGRADARPSRGVPAREARTKDAGGFRGRGRVLEWEARPSTSTPRKERRAVYYKDVVQEHARNIEEQAEAREGSGKSSSSKDSFAPAYPLWTDRPQKPRRKTHDEIPKSITTTRPVAGPFGALNQRSARLPNARPKAWPKKEGEEEPRDREPYKRTKPSEVAKDKDKGKSPRRELGDYHALKMQQALATVGYGSRNVTKTRISAIESFSDFSLMPSIQEAITEDALKGLVVINPTPIQSLAIPMLMGTGEGRRRRREPSEEMQQFLLAAETGSGKTMAYLLPAIDAMKRAEAEEKRRDELEAEQKKSEVEEKEKTNMFALEAPIVEDVSNAGRPRVIVLVPTAELVEQVGQLAKSLSHKVKYRTAFVSSNYSGTVINNRLFSPIDILISTPHLLASVAESEPNILSRVSHLIIDEADSLFDRSFSPTTSAIVDKASPSLKQLVLCSATIPKRLDNYLRERFPDIKRLTTPNLHAIPRRVQLGVVDVDKDPYRGNKDLACADIIWKIGSSASEHSADELSEKTPTKRLIVFVNEREKSVELAAYLVTKGIDAIALNRDLETRQQTAILAQFTSLASPIQETKVKEDAFLIRKTTKKTQRVLPNTKVLVCTDIASRGIDTTAVRHVVLYDVPHTSIDFIHRLGRTGRMGRRGRGVVLVGKGDRRDVVKEIREAMFKGAALI